MSIPDDKNETIRVEDLTISNSVTLTALAELLEERGIVSGNEVLERAKVIVGRSQPNA